MSYKLDALIFDVDGTIADTEQYGHLPAANQAMQELGLDIEWNWPVFSGWINTIPGNANRLIHSLNEKKVSEKEIAEIVAKFVPLKKEIYIDQYLPNLTLRPGITAIMQEAIDSGVKLAVVSTSHEVQIKALFNSKLSQYLPYFLTILGKETGTKTENDGFLHKKCLEIIQSKPEETIVIEDAQNGLDAAQCANIPTAVFYNDYTYGSPFAKAKLVAPSIKYFNLQTIANICLN